MTDPDLSSAGTDVEPAAPFALAALATDLAQAREILAEIPDAEGAARWVADRTAHIFSAAITLELAAHFFSDRASIRSWRCEAPDSAKHPSPPATTLELPLRARQVDLGTLQLTRHGAVLPEAVRQALGEWIRHVGLVLDGLLLHAELCHARAAMDRVDLRLQDLVARIGHDLRAPMGAVLMWLHVARQATEPSRNDALDALSAIEAGAREQNVLISELVDLTRARAGHLALNRMPVRFDELVDEVVFETARQARMRGVGLDRTPAAPGGDLVFGDQPRLLQSIVNVVSHAIRISRPGRRVVLACVPEMGWARLEIRGAFEEVDLPGLERLLRPFAPAELFAEGDATAAVDLRLSYAYAMVALHRGRLEALRGPPVAVVIRLPLLEMNADSLVPA